MDIFTAAQLKWLDQLTIDQQEIRSIDLMERAAERFVQCIFPDFPTKTTIGVFCGTGNNGGDGFAIARLLKNAGFEIDVFLVPFGEMTNECHVQFEKWNGEIVLFNEQTAFGFEKYDVVIDALLGIGCTKQPEGELLAAIGCINRFEGRIYAVDLPSGLSADFIPPYNNIVQADRTITFHSPKLTFFLPETAHFVGDWIVLDIGLVQTNATQVLARYHVVTDQHVRQKVPVRKRFSNKGSYGHGLLVAGSWGKLGAAQLCAAGALRSGIGLLTAHIPACGIIPLQIAVPEAMVHTDPMEKQCSTIESHSKLTYQAVGIGPGMGVSPETLNVLDQVFAWNLPTVIDADALNTLAMYPDNLANLPTSTILTPHPKEFERLAGKSTTSSERLERLRHYAQTYRCCVILKDAITTIAFPSGQVYFNLTGNPGMATGGSGDVLTGIVLGLLAQGIPAEDSALLAVYFHGLAGDQAKKQLGERALLARDIISHLRIEK